MAEASQASVEIKNVNLVVVHNSHAPITFEGKGSCPLAGPLKIKGAWLLNPGELTVTLQAEAVPLTPSFMQRLAAYWPEAADHAEQLEGIASLQAELTYRSGAAGVRPLSQVAATNGGPPEKANALPCVPGAWSHRLHWRSDRA